MEPNKKIGVVFDTNSYRDFVKGKDEPAVIKSVNEMRALEQKKNIQAYGSVIVGMEMLGNLAEGEGGFNYRDCLNGIIAMGHHCWDESIQDIRITPQAKMHIMHSFFSGVDISSQELANRNMGSVIKDFKLNTKAALEYHNKQDNFNRIKTDLANKELVFAQQIVTLVEAVKASILKESPNIQKNHLREKLLPYLKGEEFKEMMAMAIITALADSVNVPVNDEQTIELAQKALDMINVYPLSVGFYSWISHEIADKNIDMFSKNSQEKKWNWLWDYDVSFLLSESKLDGRDVILVTRDKDITKILTEYGYGDRVYNLEAYMEYLNK